MAGTEPFEIHAGRHHRDGDLHRPRPQVLPDHLGGRDDGIGARGEARAQTDGRRLHQAARERHIVSVLLVPRVIGEHHRATLTPTQTARRRPEQKGMVSMEDVEVESADPAHDAGGIRHGQGKVWIGRGGHGGIADDAGPFPSAPREAGREDPDVVTPRLQALA